MQASLTRGLILVLAMAVTSATLGAQANEDTAKAPKQKKDRTVPLEPSEIEGAKRRTERLFGPDEPLEFTLTADYKAVFRSRDTLDVKSYKASLVVKDSSGAPVTLDMEIEPRGHFRLRANVCDFPPIKLKFPKDGLKGTPFAGQKTLKLGTHCRQRNDEYGEYPVREHAVYEVFNLITDASFKSRLARVTYVPAGEPADSFVRWGILIEDEDDVAKRNGGRIDEARGARYDDVEHEPLVLMSLFYYLVGNTDWSLASLHNIRLVAYPDGRYMAIPYDFDWSGVVFARYAVPAPQLGLRTVQDRIYRGPCKKEAELAPLMAKFTEKEEAIRALYQRLPLDERYRRRAMEYYDDFFRMGKDRRLMKRDLIDACVSRPSARGIPAPSTPRGDLARALGL